MIWQRYRRRFVQSFPYGLCYRYRLASLRWAVIPATWVRNRYLRACTGAILSKYVTICQESLAYHTSGCSSMKLFIKAWHSRSSSTTTSIPRCLRYSSPPTNVTFSASTTRFNLYRIHAPVHISHGESVVYIVAPAYTDAGSLPLFSKADISAFTHEAINQSHLSKSCNSLHAELHSHFAPSCYVLFLISYPPWRLDRLQWAHLLPLPLPWLQL